jgi:chemotaxis protein MotB
MTYGSGSRVPAHDRWLVSYADFITLLFAFFATMYAISNVDAQKLATVAHAMNGAFDDRAHAPSTPSASGLMPERDPRLVERASPDVVPAILTRSLAPELAAHRVELRVDHRGVVVSIPEAGVFALGSDELSTPARAFIARLAVTLGEIPNAVRVEGHTDDLPIHTTRFRSNWDLSTARATRVIELLMQHPNIDPQRLSAAGYAEFHPRVDNASAETRTENRRVDLVILNELTSRAEEPAGRRP